MDQGFSKAVYAATEEEVQTEYAKMMADLEANDAPSIEQIYTQTYQARATLWNK